MREIPHPANRLHGLEARLNALFMDLVAYQNAATKQRDRLRAEEPDLNERAAFQAGKAVAYSLALDRLKQILERETV